MFLILLGASFLEPRLRLLRPFALPWRLAPRELFALWRLGLPMGAMILAEVGVFSAATMAMGLIGRTALEAHTAALQIVSIAFMVPLGLGIAAMVRVGLAYGAHNARAIAHAGWCAFGLTLLYAVLSATVMISAPRVSDRPLHQCRRARECERRCDRRHAAESRGDLPDRRCESVRPREHAARTARFKMAFCHRDCWLLGGWRAGRPCVGLLNAARRCRHLDRPCDRPCCRRRSSLVALDRQGAPGFCSLTLGLAQRSQCRFAFERN